MHFVSKARGKTTIKEKARLESELKLQTQMAQVSGGKQKGNRRRVRPEDGETPNEELSFSYQNQILAGRKNRGVGNINQSVHLVGSHMADQHANSANLLIFSNGVQLIPLAAFISPSHTEGREVKDGERTEEGLL